MGVSLKKIVKGHEISLNSLKGKRIGVDAFNTIYQFISTIRQYDGTPLMDSKGRITSHLSGLFYRNMNLLEKGIKLIYVFDGKPPSFKSVLKERIERRKHAQKEYQEAIKEKDYVSAKKWAQQGVSINEEIVKQSKELLKAMGISVIQAPEEGEAQAAYINQKGDVWAVASQDIDSVLFGCEHLIKNINIVGKRKVPGRNIYIKIEPVIIASKEWLKNLGLTREQLIIASILVGTDYNPGGVKGIGPAKALKLVREEKNLNNILKRVNWNFDIDAREILNYFLNPVVEKNYTIKQEVFDEEKIKRILVDEYEFSEERIASRIEKAFKNNKKQKSLSSFF